MNFTIALRPSCLRLKLNLKPPPLNLYSTSTANERPFEIPKRIPRGPTDILRALESTITRDPTAAHYKYHDDPYLIPASNAGKRSFALAQEAGRKAAHWIRQQHSDLFQHQEADPPVESFIPKMVYNEKSDVVEDDLRNVIDKVQVSDAILIYKLLVSKNGKVSDNLKQDLLELVCFYNEGDALDEEFIEERWFMQNTRNKERKGKTWKDGGVAEELFITFDSPTPEAYSAIIQGMAKHYQVDRAWQLFEESQQKHIQLNTDTYNALIRVSNILKEGYDLRWQLVLDLLGKMSSEGLKPNLGTLNAVLEALSTMGGSPATKKNVFKVLTEFKNIGIEPSLGSWYLILNIFCRERGPVSTILYDIMSEIEGKHHSIRDVKDVNFFVTAMDVCRNHLSDKELAKRVDKLLHFGNNYDLIGDSYKESIYYRNYFMLLCTTEPIEDFMSNLYNKLVPHVYIPEPIVMGEILKSIEASGAIEYLPKMWSDMIVFDHLDRENLVLSILSIMVSNKPESGSELHAEFGKTAWDIYSKIIGQDPEKKQKLSVTGNMLGNIMLLLLRSDEFDKASTVLEKLDKEHNSIPGVPNFEVLSHYVDSCIERKLPSTAIRCIQYSSDCGFPETISLAKKLRNQMTLDTTHLSKISNIIGTLPDLDTNESKVESRENK